MKNKVLQLIKDAAVGKEKILDLRGNRLSELPPEIGQLTRLTHLDLSFNTLNGLPPEIRRLTELTDLDLSDNRLNEPPPEIWRMTGLTSLDLSGNQLSELPSDIGQLTRLTHLDLRDNRLSGLPPEISRLSGLTIFGLSGNRLMRLPPELCRLIDLTLLDLSFNRLSELPHEISSLSGLIHLDLSDNRLDELPREIGQLTGLTDLDLHGNRLSDLPPEISRLAKLTALDLSNNRLNELPRKITRLTGLTDLDLHGNRLSVLPPEISRLTELTSLDLTGNRLSGLPPQITQLTDLDAIYLDDNPLTSPPLEIGRQGGRAVRKYFASLEGESQVLAEVKVLLVGEGGSGKTSLTRCLQGERFNKNEPSTDGISIKEWPVQTADKQLKVNVWDFGGREIMHTAHQLFLSKRSLYVLVLDGGRDERPEYWLRHIESFGGDSPVLIVLNKQDINPGFTVNQRFLRWKYPQIRGFFQTSCAVGHGIADFKAALIRELTRVKFIESRWMKSWFKVKQEVEQLEKPYINYDQFKEICVNAGVTEEASQKVLIDFLNDLGAIVHFKKFGSEGAQVLDPKWVTTAVYKILNAESAAVRNGFLPLSSLKVILTCQKKKNDCYPESRYSDLVDLMKKIELCCAHDAERMLIPQLLDTVEPAFEFDYASSLRFMLDYDDFLPLSILPRFIVKRYQDVKDGLCWRTGIVLENKAFQSTALVRADNAANRIYIYVNGAQRKVYLALIRLSFLEINDSFEKLKVTERVPMPDHPECAASYTTLLTYAEKELDVYIPEGSDKVYRVSELLDAVRPDEHGEGGGALNIERIKSRLTGGNSFAEERNRLAALKPDVFRLGDKK
jgi:small GTP-binding protein